MNKKEHLAQRIGVKCTSRFAARVRVARHPYDPKYIKLPKWMMKQIRHNIAERVRVCEMAFRTAVADYNLHPPQTVDEELYKGLRLIALRNNILAARPVTAKDISILGQSESDD